jgi:hypothetical protein
MKVIKPGRAQQGWSAELVCTGRGNGGGGCGATLLVEYADIYLTSSSHYDGSTDTFRTFTCGACGVETDLPENGGPPGPVQSKTQWQARRR